ncbi:MAG TPA: ferritin-like domain-containing protein [Chloroflexota bacterium]|nr:ferritin-like domain-containing protein [Chloroflexota bacterium]
MSEEDMTRQRQGMQTYLTARVSRAKLLATLGAGTIAAAGLPSLASAQSSTETVQDIINIADTAEHLAITLLTAAVNNASTLGISGLVLDVVQAALVEEVYHAEFLESAGAKTLTDTFTVPDPKILTDFTTFFNTVQTLETAFVGAYLAAVGEFTSLNQPTLAKYAFEIGAVEAEHRTLARAALALASSSNTADVPPNNVAFESRPFNTVGDAAKALQTAGFIGGSGTQVTYPGTSAALTAAGAMASAVMNQTVTNATPTRAYPAPSHHHGRRHAGRSHHHSGPRHGRH